MADAAVAGWLEEMGLEALISVFEREGVDSEALAALSNFDLKELGVTRLGDRAKLQANALRSTGDIRAIPADHKGRTQKKSAAVQAKPSWMQILEDRAVGSPHATPGVWHASTGDYLAIFGEGDGDGNVRPGLQEYAPPPPSPRGMTPSSVECSPLQECAPHPPTPRGLAPALTTEKSNRKAHQYKLPRKQQVLEHGESPAAPDTTPVTVQKMGSNASCNREPDFFGLRPRAITFGDQCPQTILMHGGLGGENLPQVCMSLYVCVGACVRECMLAFAHAHASHLIYICSRERISMCMHVCLRVVQEIVGAQSPVQSRSFSGKNRRVCILHDCHEARLLCKQMLVREGPAYF
jgi:hypothetical protein